MTPSIPALRAALAASSGQFPWTADQNLVFDADGHPVAEPCQRAHEDEDARLIALAVNALPKLLDIAEAAAPFAEAFRQRATSTNKAHALTSHEAALVAAFSLEAPDGR